MTDRLSRQRELVPTERLHSIRATVIGVGAIGRQVALQLAALGIRQLQLIDFDTVELTNVTTQGYRQADLGLQKVVATARAVGDIDPTVGVTSIADRFRPRHPIGEAVFCCVDSISTRAAVWRAVCQFVPFWTDGRMLGEVMRVLTVTNEEIRAYYPTTLFEQSAAQSGSCTAHGTIYTANIAAGLMVHQFTRWLRNVPVEPDLVLNLLSAEITTV